MKTCTKCQVEKSLEDFYYRKDTGKYRNECRECVKAHRSKYRKDNPSVVNAANRKNYWLRKLGDDYRAFLKRDNRAFASKASSHNKRGFGGRLLASEIKELYNQHSWSCYYCGVQEPSTTKLELDHVVPLERGGENHISNCVPACTHCNRTKNTKTEREFNNE
jgi:5-methylcytosine-specific restriction endonuclease McrA